MRDVHTLNLLYELKDFEGESTREVHIRIDPTLNIALALALGQGFIERGKGGKVAITALGNNVLAEMESNGILSPETIAISMLGKSVSEDKAKELLKGEIQ
jgi:hypothetical protein